MKKLSVVVIGTAFLLLIGGCGQKKAEEKSGETAMSTEESVAKITDVEKSSETEQNTDEESSVFTGILNSDAVYLDGDTVIQVSLQDIEAINDPETILPMMESNGVLLNVPTSHLAEGTTLDGLKAETKIQFTLNGLPIMTQSIPPQIPGNSIQQIEIVK